MDNTCKQPSVSNGRITEKKGTKVVETYKININQKCPAGHCHNQSRGTRTQRQLSIALNKLDLCNDTTADDAR